MPTDLCRQQGDTVVLCNLRVLSVWINRSLHGIERKIKVGRVDLLVTLSIDDELNMCQWKKSNRAVFSRNGASWSCVDIDNYLIDSFDGKRALTPEQKTCSIDDPLFVSTFRSGEDPLFAFYVTPFDNSLVLRRFSLGSFISIFKRVSACCLLLPPLTFSSSLPEKQQATDSRYRWTWLLHFEYSSCLRCAACGWSSPSSACSVNPFWQKPFVTIVHSAIHVRDIAIVLDSLPTRCVWTIDVPVELDTRPMESFDASRICVSDDRSILVRELPLTSTF